MIDILLPKTKPITVGCVYRPPKDGKFIDNFESVASNIRSDCESYFLGDFNINFKHRGSSLLKKYESMLNMYGLSQIIEFAIRSVKNSSSLLDHILCNSTDHVCQSGTLNTGLSDNAAIYCTRKVTKVKVNIHNTIKIRSMRSYSKDMLLKCLQKTDWSNIVNSTNVNHAWGEFKRLFLEILDEIAPIKEIRLKCHTEPWMNNEILNNIYQRDKYVYSFRKDKSNKDVFNKYGKLRNKIQRDIKKAKSNYFQNKVNECKNDLKKLWKHLNSLGFKKPKTASAKIVLEANDNLYHKPFQVANLMNSFFASVFTSLVNKLPVGKDLFSTFSHNLKKLFIRKRKCNLTASLSILSKKTMFLKD